MAQLSLGESRWRMLRRVFRKRAFRFEDARNQTRFDRPHFDWLVANGFVSPVRDEVYQLTGRGKAAADLGLYDWDPAVPAATPPVTRPKRER